MRRRHGQPAETEMADIERRNAKLEREAAALEHERAELIDRRRRSSYLCSLR
jgi:cell division protein FtsB